VSGKFVPWQKTAKRKQHLLSAAFSYLKCAELHKNFFKNTVTGDKTWMHSYDPKTKHLPSKWKTLSSPHTKKAGQVQCKTKMMIINFFLLKKAFVHHDHALYGQTVNKHFHLEILRYLDGAVCQKQPKNGSEVHGKKIL
jgi:hypothetical protein